MVQLFPYAADITYYYLDGIASIMLRGFTASCDRIMLTVSKPEESSRLRNSISVRILSLRVSASISISVNFPINGSLDSGVIMSITNNLALTV